MAEVKFEVIRHWITPNDRDNRIIGSVAGILKGPGLTPQTGADQTIYTVEKAWVNNERRISCIPEGTYKITPHHTEKFPNTFEVNDVPNRDAILVHGGNTEADVIGCIAVGHDLMFKLNRGMPYATVAMSQIALNRVRVVWNAILTRGDTIMLTVRCPKLVPQ